MKKFFQVILFTLFFSSISAHSLSMSTVGDVGQVIMPLGAAIKTISINDQEGLKQFLTSFAISSAAVYMLKEGVHSTRPNGADYSFPSGHTTVAFVSATYLQRRYGWTYGLPAYVLAAFIGYSRIATDNHWPIDVIAGAALGMGTSYLFTTPYQKKISVHAMTDEKGTYVQVSVPLQ